MKKPQLVIISIVLQSIFFLSCRNDNNPTVINKIDIEPLLSKEWNYLFYDDADFEYAYNPPDDFSELVSSNSDINYLVLTDRNDGGAGYYIINKDYKDSLIQSSGEVNMGSSKTLSDFINFAEKYFPARRNIIAFYDHGGGRMGTCWYVGSNNDNLIILKN